MTDQTHCAHGYRLDEKCARCDAEVWQDERRQRRIEEGMEILHEYERDKGRR